MDTLIKLFWAFFQIGLFSIGGGYAAIPLIESQVIDSYHWMTAKEFTDLITISQMTPGPIAINSASFIGARMAGVPGALVATLGCVLPSCVIVLLIAWLYRRYSNLRLIDGALKGLRPAVVGMIATAALTMLQSSFWAATGTSIGGVDIHPDLCLIPDRPAEIQAEPCPRHVRLRRYRLDRVLHIRRLISPDTIPTGFLYSRNVPAGLPS